LFIDIKHVDYLSVLGEEDFDQRVGAALAAVEDVVRRDAHGGLRVFVEAN
jgi:hypothetical protein